MNSSSRQQPTAMKQFDSQGVEMGSQNFRMMLGKKVNQIQVGFDRKVKDIKPMLLENACDFLKEKTDTVTKMLTKHHRDIVKQFIEYKERSTQTFKDAKKIQDDVAMLEQMIALKMPVMQAEYYID